MKTQKYTDEQFEEIKQAYSENPTIETIEYLADKLKKPKRSIIAKLASAGVYKKRTYAPKYGGKPTTKVDIVKQMASSLGLQYSELEGLIKAEKLSLLTLEKTLKKIGVIELSDDETTI